MSNSQIVLKQAGKVYLEKIVIENFKSFGGIVEVGCFSPQTNAIIGPNGSGKSNLLEAISFVLGIQARDLRGKDLEQLVYSSGHKEKSLHDENITCSVSLHLRETGTDSTQYSDVIFKRSAKYKKGSSQYSVDGKNVTQEDYWKALFKFGILPKVKNCIIKQGEVERISQQTSKQLCELIDEVSGSAGFKDRYNSLKTNFDELVTQTSSLLKEKTRMDNEVKKYRNEVEELNQYNELREKLKEEKILLTLFQTRVAEIQYNQSTKKYEYFRAVCEKLKEETKIKQIETNKAELAVKYSEKMISAANKSAEEIELKLSKMKDGSAGSGIKAAEDAYRQSIEEIEKYQNELSEMKTSLTKLETEKNQLEQKRSDLESGVGERESVKLKKKDSDEYEKLKNIFTIKTLAQSAAREGFLFDAEKCESKIKNAQQLRDSIISEIELLENSVVSLNEKNITLQNDLEKNSTEFKNESNKNSLMANRLETVSEQLRELESQISSCDQILSSSDANSRENQKQKAKRKLVAQLKKSIPGVYDQLGSLLTIRNKKDSKALQAALGVYAEYVVVDTYASARDCIQLMKQQKEGHLDFLPLDGLHSHPFDVSVRDRGTGIFRPAIDLISFDKIYIKAVQTALDNSVIVDDMPTANKVAFEMAPRMRTALKVITIRGDRISKDGNYAAESETRGGTVFDRNLVEKAKEDLNSLRSEKSEVDEEMRHVKTEIKKIEENLSNMTKEKSEIEFKLQNLKTSNMTQNSKIDFEKQRVLELETEIAKWSKELKSISANVTKSSDLMAEIEKEVFCDLTKRIGCDIRVIERDLKKAKEEKEKKKFEIDQQLATLHVNVDKLYRKFGLPVNLSLSPSSKLTSCRTALENGGRSAQLISNREVLLKQINDLKLTEQRRQENIKKLESDLSDQFSSLSRLKNSHSNLEDIFTSSEEELKKIKISCHEKQLKMQNEYQIAEQLRITFIESIKGTQLDGIELPTTNGTYAQYVAIFTEDSQYDVDLDSSKLPHEDLTFLRHFSGEDKTPEHKLRETAHHDRIYELTIQLERTKPNMNAKHTHEIASQQLKSITEKLQTMMKDQKTTQAYLKKVHHARTTVFSDCFKRTQKALSKIYAEMTSTLYDTNLAGSEYRAGLSGFGKAYLEYEDPHAPDLFDSGLLFHAVPPSKRFQEVETLSGGEKTMASVSLLFALHVARPAPFFILDEVDAALDPLNAGALAAYLTKRATFQVIIVSHRPQVYSETDVLFGVYKDARKGKSEVLRLCLNNYDIPDDEECEDEMQQ